MKEMRKINMLRLLFLSLVLAIVPSVSGEGFLAHLVRDAENDSPLPSSVFSCFKNTKADACVAATDQEECMWCGMGGDTGMCLEKGLGNTVNAAGMPHLTCGNQQQIMGQTHNREQNSFWPDSIDCLKNSISDKKCSETATRSGRGCSWCSIHTPTDVFNLPYDDETSLELTGMPRFGLCVSNDFTEEIDSILPLEDAQTMELKNAASCGADASNDPGLMDLKCASMTALGQTMCEVAAEDCEWSNVFGHTNVCLSKIQSGIVRSIELMSGSLHIITEAARRK